TAFGDRGILVVGGASSGTPVSPTLTHVSEWLDFWGTSCTSTDIAVCDIGEVPIARIDHIAIELGEAFAASCPHRGSALVGLGADDQGHALDDLYLFDPDGLSSGGAFTRLTGLGVSPRIGATAFASADCRVAIVGGHSDSSGETVAAIDVLLFDAAGVALETSSTTLAQPNSSAALIATGNSLGEVVVAGGVDSSGNARQSAVALRFENGSLRVCPLSDAACNGNPAAMICPRAGHAAAVIDRTENATRALVIGGDLAGGCGVDKNAEVFATAVEPPYNRFTSLAAQPVTARTVGHTTSSTVDGEVLIVGGLDASGTPRNEVEVLQATPALSFSTRPALSTPRAFHRVVRIGGALVLVGGFNGTSAVGGLELYIPGF
ncbi:MAG: hypothetical protein JXR83_02080, partial [Deltaproteobacteria bacterium]|nr:hypothetical protein [Deltaproteobacteria bacterium]